MKIIKVEHEEDDIDDYKLIYSGKDNAYPFFLIKTG